jgi:hypothetical protein
MHRKALLSRNEARSPGDGPAFEHAIHLETEIIVEAARVVLLHHIAATALVRGFLDPASRLGGGVEATFATIGLERHD